jgi:hypothetical protein
VVRLHERLLYDILGIVTGTEQYGGPVCERGVPDDQDLVRVQVAVPGPGHHGGLGLGLVQFAPPLLPGL